MSSWNEQPTHWHGDDAPRPWQVVKPTLSNPTSFGNGINTPKSLLNVEIHNVVAPFVNLEANSTNQSAVTNRVRRILEEYQMKFGEPIQVMISIAFRTLRWKHVVESSMWEQNNRYAQKPDGVKIEVNEPVEDFV